MPLTYYLAFFLACSGDRRDLHSFPTRRSSDLKYCLPKNPRLYCSTRGLNQRLGQPCAATQSTGMSASTDKLVQSINDVLPQTQCTRCGYDACLPYRSEERRVGKECRARIETKQYTRHK